MSGVLIVHSLRLWGRVVTSDAFQYVLAAWSNIGSTINMVQLNNILNQYYYSCESMKKAPRFAVNTADGQNPA